MRTGYTEHNEDLVIFNLLEQPNEHGLFVDCGSHSMTSASVSRFFSERGWTTINIEAQRRYYDMAVQMRPQDINLNIAVGEKAGFLTLYEADGLTTARREWASADWQAFIVPMLPLSIIYEYFVADKENQVLKLDIEGSEKAALLGMDFKKWRPYVICSESVQPMDNSKPVFQEWEYILFEADYEFKCWDDDGYSRFYTRKEGW